MRLLRLVAIWLLLWSGGAALHAQESPEAESQEPYFSGTVVHYEGNKLTVSRTVLGKASSQRTFLVTPSTRIEGRLRVKSRVTVQFASTPEGDQATHIIVRGGRK